jgi:hypothetical protein
MDIASSPCVSYSNVLCMAGKVVEAVLFVVLASAFVGGDYESFYSRTRKFGYRRWIAQVACAF